MDEARAALVVDRRVGAGSVDLGEQAERLSGAGEGGEALIPGLFVQREELPDGFVGPGDDPATDDVLRV
jgi:hypothetical protein